jgi:hypothetical protein
VQQAFHPGSVVELVRLDRQQHIAGHHLVTGKEDEARVGSSLPLLDLRLHLAMTGSVIRC